MTCLENFLGKPVILQLGDPIAAAHSEEEVSIESDEDGVENTTCGRATLFMVSQKVVNQQGQPMIDPATNKPAVRQQPILVQVIKGEIEAVDERGVAISTVGGDDKTQVLLYIPRENIRAVTFALEHVELEVTPEPSPILKLN